MALDTYTELWNRVRARCSAAGPLLCQDWVRNSFRRVAERRRWSWLIGFSQFIAPAQYNTGTANVSNGSTTVTGNGTAWTSDMVGLQFRTGLNSPIYTIAGFNSATSIELASEWGPASGAAIGYRIYQCYFTAPEDFHSFVSLWDPNFAYQLRLDIQQQELNDWDPQRSNTGQSQAVASLDYDVSRVGTVGVIVQALGAGPAPVAGGTYAGVNNAIFTLQVTVGGVSGVAQFKWKKNNGAFSPATFTDVLPVSLQDGVVVTWPDTVVYVVNDTFVVSATPISAVGLPRYELWPHQTSAYVYPFLYEKRIADLSDAGATLPRYIRGDVLVEMSLAEAAKWPGPAVNDPNPYFNLGLADRHRLEAERMIMELERQDDEVYQLDAVYPQINWPYAPMLGDSAWLQRHAI